MSNVLKYVGGFLLIACLTTLTLCVDNVESPDVVEEEMVEITETETKPKYYVTGEVDRLAAFNVQNYNSQNELEITVNTEVEYQEIDGFGFALTGGSVLHLNALTETNRTTLLNELFGSSSNDIGISYIRISIGASDLDVAPYSYNDLEAGLEDIDQLNFSIAPAKEGLIPLLKEILAINPNLKIMASPWSPPVWMKSNQNTIGGKLIPKYYDSYALYLAKYFQAMSQEGIEIHSMSIQNEPLHDGNNPSLHMTAEEQRDFIKGSLGPTFSKENIDVKLLVYDHNADRPDYPITILSDPEAAQYVSGSAFHLYRGTIDQLSKVHEAFPDKGIYFTEQWFGAPGNFTGDLQWHVRELLIGATRNWSKNIIEWNLTSTPDLKPHTEGGCNKCLGGITIDGTRIIRNAGYYVIAHDAKWIASGSKRIFSTEIDGLPNVAFKNPDGVIVVIILNDTSELQFININQDSNQFSIQLDAGSVTTVVLNQSQ